MKNELLKKTRMESETISKNGASPKSLMSRGNILLLCGALFVAGFVCSGCDKDPEEGGKENENTFNRTITAVVENGNAYNDLVSRVAAMIEYYDEEKEKWNQNEIASGSYVNGGFTLTLPETIDSKYLISGDEWSDEWNWGGGADVSISDKNALITELMEGGIWLYACLDTEPVDGMIYGVDGVIHGKVDGSSFTLVQYMYADRDVTIKINIEEDGEEDGEVYKWEFRLNLSLKKGWNMVYHTDSWTETSNKLEWTTTAVSGLKWYFAEEFWGSDYMGQSTPKNLKSNSAKTPKSLRLFDKAKIKQGFVGKP